MIKKVIDRVELAKKELRKKEKEKEEKQRAAFCQFLKEQYGFNCVAEFRFHPTRKWRGDFFFQGKIKLMVEVEGGIYVKGRHITPSGFLADIEKYNALTEQGIYLLRTTPKDWNINNFHIERELLKLLKKLL